MNPHTQASASLNKTLELLHGESTKQLQDLADLLEVAYQGPSTIRGSEGAKKLKRDIKGLLVS